MRRATIDKDHYVDNRTGISIHALLAESDDIQYTANHCRRVFLSTLSLRRATFQDQQEIITATKISIHALLAESDNVCKAGQAGIIQFLSTLSLRRATMGRNEEPFRGGISIHALLAESDVRLYRLPLIALLISIHALLAESDSAKSTPEDAKRYFYPRSPCGERRDVIAVITDAQSISIHALLAESDQLYINRTAETVVFLSTLSLRRATRCCMPKTVTPIYFYPRSPCGERRDAVCLRL